MRVIVCGGRDYHDRRHVFEALDRIHTDAWLGFAPVTVVVHGACPSGADLSASKWAVARGIQEERHPANWKAYGRSAGPRRNQEMADVGADLCVAFKGYDGTADMVRRAYAARIPVLELGPGAMPTVPADWGEDEHG